jgi:hypothetical protein
VSLFVDLKSRNSDSPFAELIQHGRVGRDGSTIRPAEIHWHLVVSRYRGHAFMVLGGPLTASGVVTVPEGAEIVWIKLKLGAFMPHLPTRDFVDAETILPEASSRSFWLHGSAWPFPDYENADTFLDRLAADGTLLRDPLVHEVLEGSPQELSARTIRHRFQRATGLTHRQVRQFERAQQATALLERGVPILDAVFEAGYYDQPHLTRALKHWIGLTPAQIQPSTHAE